MYIPVFGTFYSDNKILKEPALSCLLKFNCLWNKHLSLIQDIGKNKLNCSITIRHKEILILGRVDVKLYHLGMLCVPSFSSLSIEECHNILPCKRTLRPSQNRT